MTIRSLYLAPLALALLLPTVMAADTPVSFDDPAKRARYESLLEELRCLVCQNQSLADSHADLAQDLRDEVYAMVSDGKDKQAVTDFMIARYGDFVLYKPPLKSSTWLLWFGPLLLVLLALVAVWLTTRRPSVTAATLSDGERAEAEALIGGERE